MPNAAVAVLEPVGEARIALESVDIQANLWGLFSDVVVTQSYRNLESVNIEAVYTFPLPLDAVLLDLTLEFNGKTMRGVVQPKTEAEERYEDAIEGGDSAILLQQLEPGVFMLNVGNILPNEQAVVRFRYAQLHRWQGHSLRFYLPTTIAPRYGDLSASGLASYQVPEYTLSSGHGFSLVVRIEGALSGSDFECPSHPVAVSTDNGVREISLSGGSTLMDRDFVLEIKEPAASAVEGLRAPDQEEHVVLASFHPVFPEAVPASPRCVKLVVDCSGSMSGDSITQAKAALLEIISLLKPNDFFNLIAFGSRFNLLFPEPVVANRENIEAAARFVEQVDANMGGTEIGSALNAAYRCGKVEGLSADLLLITDGEVWNYEQVVKDAQQSGHRIFTVGVGSAVSEAFVRSVAETTSGACELVSPRENMSERIVRHFQRIDQPKAQAVRIEWPSAPIRQIPAKPEAVYAGDTLHIFGWFPERPAGKVRLVMAFEDGRSVVQEVSLSTEFGGGEEFLADLPRVAAHTRLPSLDSREAAELAARYQLVTEHTSCVLVFEREKDAKSAEVPALRKVPNLLAAGWGGVGSVQWDMAMEAPAQHPSAMGMDLDLMVLCAPDLAYMDIPSSLRRQASTDFSSLVLSLNARYPDTVAAKLDITTIEELLVLGLDQGVADALSDLIGAGVSERDIVAAFLSILSVSTYGKGFSRHVKRLIRMAEKGSVLDAVLVEAIKQLINS